MVARKNQRGSFECVLCDMNTQEDFLGADAVCQICNPSSLTSAARRVVAWAKWNSVPVISSIDSHRGEERTHDGFPSHCVDGTEGQRKLSWSLFGSRVMVEGDCMLSVPLNLFSSYQQVIFRKRTHDLLCNPKADRFITQLDAQEYILFGVGIEYSMNALAMGLLARNKRVTIVSDCCGYWSESEADLALRRVHTKGASLTSVDELLQRRLDSQFRYPLRSRNRGVGCVQWNGYEYVASNGNGSGQSNGKTVRNGTSRTNGNGHLRENGNGTNAHS